MPAVGELVRCTDGRWMIRPPQPCPRGHRLTPGRVSSDTSRARAAAGTRAGPVVNAVRWSMPRRCRQRAGCWPDRPPCGEFKGCYTYPTILVGESWHHLSACRDFSDGDSRLWRGHQSCRNPTVGIGTYDTLLSDCSCDALDNSEPSVGEGESEVLGFLREVSDEGVQSEWVGRQCQPGLHEFGRLGGEIVPVVDREP
jgi:hypothetical protein